MPDFTFKKGEISPEFLDYVGSNKKDSLFITADIETVHVRLRGAFHAILIEWHLSQMYSCRWNNKFIKTLGGLKKYYKYHGCQGKVVKYTYAGEESDDLNFFLDNLPPYHHRFIVYELIPWEKMSREQKSRALNIMLTEIKLCDDLPIKLQKSIAILERDWEALKSIGYAEYAIQFLKEKYP